MNAKLPMIGWRRFFLAAGVFNVFGGVMGFATLERGFSDHGMELPRYPYALQLLFLMVIIMGIGYVLVWRDPIRHRGIVWLGLMTKVAGFFMTYWALSSGQMPAANRLQPLIVDLPWGLAFAVFLWRTRHMLWLGASAGHDDPGEQFS